MAKPTGSTLDIQIVGRFTVLRDGDPVLPAGSRKGRLLFKLLVAERTRLLPVDQIVDLLWGARTPARAADNVASLVSRLRRELGPSLIVGGRNGYQLDPTRVSVDLDRAARWTEQAHACRDAAEPGLAIAAAGRALEILSDGDAFGDDPNAEWAAGARRQLATLARSARHVMGDAALDTGDAALTRNSAQDALAADPYDETACRLLMRALQALGEPARGIAVYAQLRDRLIEELGVDPAPETAALHLAILRDEDAVSAVGKSLRRSHRQNRGSDRAADGLGLVGRSDELARLRASWNEAAGGRPALVLLVGEAGIGKTRLSDELSRIAITTGGLVLPARCYETERSLFLQPVVEAISAAVRTLPPAVVRRAAGDAGPTLGALVPSVAAVLGAGPAARRLRPEVEARRAFEAVTTFVLGLAQRGPVVLALDDLHNAGRATVELLHYLIRHAPVSRLLILATVRAEEGREVVDLLAEVAIRLDVGALSADAVARLATAAGQQPMTEQILQRTKGHTLFVVETLRALTAGEDGVPTTLQDAVLARVQRAGRPVEELLRAGAVLGASFDPRIVARVLGAPLPNVVARGTDALTARLLVSSGRDYEFANDLVREVLYETTPAPTRLAYHQQAADLLTHHPEAVATHAGAVGDWPRAARAWLLAGEDALARAAIDDAEQLITRCLDASARADDREIRGRALVARSQAKGARGAYADAITDLEAAVLAAREVGDQRLEMVALRALGGDAPIALGHPIERATAYLRRGLQIAGALGDRAMEADLLAWLAVISCNGLRFDEAVEHSRGSVAAARASGDDDALAAALDGQKTFLAYQGEVHELGPVLDELEPLLRRRDDLFRLHWAQFESGFEAVAAGDWTGATVCFEQALTTCRRGGFSAYESWPLAHLGWLDRLQGNYDDALTLGRRAVELTEQFPHAWCAAASAAQLGTTLLETGAVAEAVDVLERGRRLVDQEGSEAYLLRCLGPLAEATGSLQTLRRADSMLARIVTPPGGAWLAGDGAYLSVARSWLARDEPVRAREVLAPMLAAARRVPWVAPLADGCLVDARAAAALGQMDEARAGFAHAAELAEQYHLPRIGRQARLELG